LSRFFRYSISGKSNIVTLREELDSVRNYAKIQNYRFQGRFVLQIEDAEPLMDVMLPKLILQPVVENAILHGLQNTLQGGLIHIQFRQVGGDVCIIVSDNGCGMTPEKLKALSYRILHGETKKGEEGHHTGIGMHNVDRRLKLYFGMEYGITIYSCETIGTDVELRIPCKPSEQP
jgi:two-component system sensor histidine kinase YesM